MTSDADAPWQPRRIAVIGVGLLGGSVAAAAKKCWPAVTVTGSSRSAETRRRIVTLKVVDEAFADTAKCVGDCDFIVIAAPVGSIARMLHRIAADSPPQAIITDVGSAKKEIVAAAEADAESAKRFVGSHPIAGSEKTGAENASADLFQGKLSVTTPTDRTDPLRHQRVQQFWRALGCRVVAMSPADHDTALASASHMPHIVSAALARAMPLEFAPLTGTGFRDATRIAAGDPLMWRQIVEANASAILEQLDRYRDELQTFRSAIAQSNWSLLEQLFAQARESKQAVESAHRRIPDESGSPSEQ